jgi:hypothetical protein
MGKTYRFRPDDDGYANKKKVKHPTGKKTKGMRTFGGDSYDDWEESKDDYEYGIFSDYDDNRQ